MEEWRELTTVTCYGACGGTTGKIALPAIKSKGRSGGLGGSGKDEESGGGGGVLHLLIR